MGTVRQSAGTIAAALCLTSAAAMRISAQEARGESVLVAGVADAETGAPLPGAILEIAELRREARTNGALAQATIRDLPAGVLQVRAHYFGYQPIETPVYFRGTDTVEVVLMMQRQVATLGTVHVTSHATEMQMRDFNRHVSRGFGRFITEDDLTKLGATPIWGTLQAKFPGLIMVWAQSDQKYIPATVFTTNLTGEPCPLQVVVNGMIDSMTDVTMIPADEIAGVEYYTGDDAPIEWRRPGSGCGILAVWTKN